MALSAALITGLILFLPRAGSSVAKNSLLPTSPDIAVSTPLSSIPSTAKEGLSSLSRDPTLDRIEEIRVQIRKRCKEAQERLRLEITRDPPAVANLEKQVDQLRKEILTTKFLVLGEQLFESSGRAEANRKALLDYLEKELEILSHQKALLDELGHGQ